MLISVRTHTHTHTWIPLREQWYRLNEKKYLHLPNHVWLQIFLSATLQIATGFSLIVVYTAQKIRCAEMYSQQKSKPTHIVINSRTPELRETTLTRNVCQTNYLSHKTTSLISLAK